MSNAHDAPFVRVSSVLREHGFERSADRINELLGLQDFEDGEQPLLPEFAQGFQRLLCEFRALGEPILGLFSEGTLCAEWRLADNKHLLIEFLDSNNLSFAMIGPDNDAPDGRYRANGRTNCEGMLEILSQRGVAQWLDELSGSSGMPA